MATNTLDNLSTAMHEKPVTSSRHSSIQITHRSERSLYTYIIHLVTRPLRNYLGRPKDEAPEGSISLKPHRISLRTCSVSHRCVCETNIYDMVPWKTPKADVKKRIYYFCGGGWQSPPSGQHWQLCAKLARAMPDTSVSVVSYPLAPKSPASKAFPQLMLLYRTLLQAAEEAGHAVILAGDSAGGNIVLSLVLEALRQDTEGLASTNVEQKKIPHPVAIMALHPSTDLTRSNPDIQALSKDDPILTLEFVQQTAKAWQGDWDPTDPRLSPIYADLSLLAKSEIEVHGVTGGYDILSPDAILFRDKCAEAGVRGQWLHWEKQMHCFLLTWPYGVHEGREAVGWVIDVLKNERTGGLKIVDNV